MIATSGGLTQQASSNPEILIVEPSTGRRQQVKFKELLKVPGGGSDITLHDGDIVYVPRSGLASFGFFMQQISPVTSVGSIATLLPASHLFFMGSDRTMSTTISELSSVPGQVLPSMSSEAGPRAGGSLDLSSPCAVTSRWLGWCFWPWWYLAAWRCTITFVRTTRPLDRLRLAQVPHRAG